MRKHLVVTVHGIGEQVPGDTVDRVVGAAREELGLRGPVTHNTVMLTDREEIEDGQLDLYPCHIRRIQQDDDTELVFAEAHWADLSRAPRGLLATVFNLLRLVLGLGYLALENVENNIVSPRSLVRKLVPLFVWVFYALIAPLNAFLFLCAVLMLSDPILFDLDVDPWRAPAFLVGIGIIQAGLGIVLTKHGQSFLAHVFSRAFCVFGLLTAAFGLIYLFVPELIDLTLGNVGHCRGGGLQNLPALSCFVGIVTFLLKTLWVTVVAMLLALVLVSAMGLTQAFSEKRSIYLAICAGLVLLWMAFSIGIWAVFKQVVTKLALIEPGEHVAPVARLMEVHFADLTQTLVYVVIALLVQAIIAGFVVRKRGRNKADLAAMPGEPSALDRWSGRLILNPSQNLSLFGAIPILAFGVFYAVAELLLPVLSANPAYQVMPFVCDALDHPLLYGACKLDTAIKPYGPLSVSLIALLGLFIVNFSDVVANVVGVARDVIVYVTRSERANPTDPGNPSRYVYRDRIERRFSNTIRKLIEEEGIDTIGQLTIMSHSQGTVVARRGLDKLTDIELPRTVLITMGSPLTHIYGHYFCVDYTFKDDGPANFKAWHNIYRADDFVGTWVLGHGTDATNHRVRPNGHGHYWTDRNVWDVFAGLGVFASMRG